MARDVADSPSFVVFKSRLSKRDALPQPEVSGFNSAIAGGEEPCPALQGSQGVPSGHCGAPQIPAASPSPHSPCTNLHGANKSLAKDESVSPLPTLNGGTDTARRWSSCIHHVSPTCPAHRCVIWMRLRELKAHMERRSRAGQFSQPFLSTLCRGTCWRGGQEGRISAQP